ncbi:hypothetical protein V8F06_008154 [Rhypophila decipiens]
MSISQRDLIRDILNWGKEHGVVLNGVKAKAIPNRGIGIVATRALKPGDTVLSIPLKATRNIKNIHPPIMFKTHDVGITDITVHSLLAVDLIISFQNNPARTTPNHNPWLAALPSLEDFTKTTPYFFPPELQALLPKPARDIIAKQNRIINHDFAILSDIYWPGSGRNLMTKEQFVHAWFIVNTRTFHYLPPGMDEKKVSWDDQMALVPIADLVNHGDGEGCVFGFSEDGFVAIVEKEYCRGEELSLCYGRHGNDALMAEYGFIMGLNLEQVDENEERRSAENRWDTVDLEEAVRVVGARQLGREMRTEELEGKQLKMDCRGNIGGDVMNVLGSMVEGNDHKGDVDERVTHLLRDVLLALHERYREVLGRWKINGETVGEESQWDILVRRWAQIDLVVDRARERQGFGRWPAAVEIC